MLSSSHRHGRARRAPWIELQMPSAQMFNVHSIHTTITSIDRARREQSSENTLSLAADVVIQTTRTFEFHISFVVLSTLHSLQDISRRNIHLSHLWQRWRD